MTVCHRSRAAGFAGVGAVRVEDWALGVAALAGQRTHIDCFVVGFQRAGEPAASACPHRRQVAG
ncbi:hypothetical protein [Cellulomonas wangsupingiae]|uniref:hypothetical protein n=1 Tax=Cellulomonas wangsupingiae TaxID=2968085 RepID=UPI001D0E79EC|nr:hypothetical protein [Cellulomonas wangsupingiae]MCM0639521.1 hypothetical protein [Cellulomonas wangsupingiae]